MSVVGGCELLRVEVGDPEAMHELGVVFAGKLSAGDLVILTGPLGAGKTTFARGIGEGLGVRGPVQSPTFVIARTHPSLSGGPGLVHLDAYRLADDEELDDLDLDCEGDVLVAEWGGGLVGVRESWLEVVIDRPSGGEGAGCEDWSEVPVEVRSVSVTGYGPKWQGVCCEW